MTSPSTDLNAGTTEAVYQIYIETPQFSESVDLIPQACKQFAQRDISIPLPDVIQQYRPEGKRMDISLPVTIDFAVKGLPENCIVLSLRVELFENDEADTIRVFELAGDVFTLDIWHLKTNTQYSYKITASLSDHTEVLASGSFATSNTPRILSIDGAVNVRDIGGWKTVSGKTVKQGLLYRGSELDGVKEESFCISDCGRSQMLEILKIRTDMDLRNPNVNLDRIDALGTDVEHIYYNAPMYGKVFSRSYVIRDVFKDLADPDKYPVYLHCTCGRDRTGIICYLLGALLGVSEDDLIREYEMTALYYGEVPTSDLKELIESLKKLEGETLQNKVEGFLLSIGVEDAEIERIRGIFLG